MRLIKCSRVLILAAIVVATCGFVEQAAAQEQSVPNQQSFWNNSKNWTTNFGPAYRDTVESPSQLLACSSQFANCFHSGSEPYPCTLSANGRSADCICKVESGTNYTLITSILNYPVYLKTIKACGTDGSQCSRGNAPVCKYLHHGALIPGANVISTFDPQFEGNFSDVFFNPSETTAKFTTCDKGPYAACMTAPCRLNRDGTASCKCPVFYGKFTLSGSDARCTLGGDLVPSASYSPILDANPND